MKFAIIIKEDFQNYTIGQVLRVYEADASEEGKGIHPEMLNGGSLSMCTHIEVPEGLDDRAIKANYNENGHDGYWDLTSNPLPENRLIDEPDVGIIADYTYVEPVPTWEIVEDADKLAEVQTADLQKLIKEKYDEMDTEVRVAMGDVFGTSSSDSANAYFETWKLMKDRPDLFVGSALKSDMEVLDEADQVLFAKDEELDTIQKIQDYANRRVEIAEEYGVWRMERIQAFRNERDSILAST